MPSYTGSSLRVLHHASFSLPEVEPLGVTFDMLAGRSAACTLLHTAGIAYVYMETGSSRSNLGTHVEYQSLHL